MADSNKRIALDELEGLRATLSNNLRILRERLATIDRGISLLKAQEAEETECPVDDIVGRTNYAS